MHSYFFMRTLPQNYQVISKQLFPGDVMDDAIYFVLILIQQQPVGRMMKRVSILMSIMIICRCQFFILSRLQTQINDDCWILDTNNMTEIGMGNCQNQVYYVNLGLGTPPIFNNFQIDTFRNLIWFPLNFTYQNTSQTIQITDKKTVTYLHRNFYEGSIGSDIVTVLQTNISTRSSVVWVNQTMDLPLNPDIAGILGLGNSPTPNFLDNAAQDNQINSSIFSLQMGGFGQPSILYYNELPKYIQQSNIYVPVIGPQIWQVRVNNVKAGGFDFSNVVANKMIIDTSTSIMYLNPYLFNKLFSKFFSNCVLDSNKRAVCPCQPNRPDITFVLQYVEITVSPQSYTKIEQGQCVLLLGQTMDNQSPMLIGSSLMKDYIITFNKESQQIGFNGKSTGSWKQLFIIFQFIMVSVAAIVLGVGVYHLMTVKYEKKHAKTNSKPKLLQLTTQFLEP